MKKYRNYFTNMGKITFLMYGLTAVLLAIFAFMVQRFEFNEKIMEIGIMAVYAISCFSGGYLAGRVIKTKKFLWGMGTGFLYFVFLALLSLIVRHDLAGGAASFLGSLILCMACGTLGGMLS